MNPGRIVVSGRSTTRWAAGGSPIPTRSMCRSSTRSHSPTGGCPRVYTRRARYRVFTPERPAPSGPQRAWPEYTEDGLGRARSQHAPYVPPPGGGTHDSAPLVATVGRRSRGPFGWFVARVVNVPLALIDIAIRRCDGHG